MKIYAFPKIKMKNSQKGEEYTLAWAKAIYSFDESKSNQFLNTSLREKFIKQRLYGAGNQDPDKYRDIYSTLDKETKIRKAYSNIDETIVPYSPKLKHAVIKMLTGNGNKLNVSLLAKSATDKRDRNKAKSLAMSMMKNDIAALDQVVGTNTQMPKFMPESVAELEAAELAGEFKLDSEIALEQGLEFVFEYQNRWEATTGLEIKENLIDIGVAGVKPFIDPQSNTLRFRTINPEYIIVDNSDYVDYRDAKFFAEIISVPLADVIINYNKTTGKTLSEDDAEKMVSSYKNEVNEILYIDGNWYDTPKQGKLKHDGRYVSVLDFVYESIDIIDLPVIDKIKVEISKDKIATKEIESGKIKENDGKYYKEKLIRNTRDVKQWRRGKLILGTEKVYDYGLVYNQIVDGDYEPMPPFILERLRTKPIMEVIMPNLDALQIDMLKLQLIKAQAAGKTLAIDVDTVRNITLGGEMFNPFDIIQMRKNNGTYYYKLTKAGIPGSMHPASQSAPFQELDGGMGSLYKELLMDIDFNIRMIQDNTGLSDIALAQQQSSEVGLGLTQMSLSSSQNIISNIAYAYKNIKEKSASVAALHLMQMAKNDKSHKYYTRAIGDLLWRKLGEEKVDDMASIGVKIQDMPSNDEVQYLMGIIQSAMQVGRNGVPAITGDEAFELISMIKEGKPLMFVNYILRQRREKRERAAQEENMQNIQAQGQQNQQMAQSANDGKMQELAIQFENKMKEMQAEYDLKLRNEMQALNLKLQDFEQDRVLDEGKTILSHLENKEQRRQQSFKI